MSYIWPNAWFDFLSWCYLICTEELNERPKKIELYFYNASGTVAYSVSVCFLILTFMLELLSPVSVVKSNLNMLHIASDIPKFTINTHTSK